MRFVIIKTTVGTWEACQQYWPAHLEYLESLRERQTLVSAGTFDDRSGGILVIEAGTLEEAISLARRDPLVAAGVDACQVRGWVPTLPRGAEAKEGPQLPLFDAKAPSLVPLHPTDGFRVVDASTDPRYAELRTMCFPQANIAPGDPVRTDYLRRRARRGLHKLVLLFEEQVVGQLEYATPEVSGLAIDGPGVAIIHCLWVIDAYTGLDGGRQLLAAAAESSGARSLATVAYNAALPSLPRSFFERHGFAVVDQIDTGRFSGSTPIVAYLLWRPLQADAPPPTWNRTQFLDGVEFCPRYPWMFGKRLYWGDHFEYHGLLVKEGLRRPELLHQLPCLAIQRTDKWTVYKVGIPAIDLHRALDLIQSALLSEPTYYAHIYGGEQMIIIYPDRVFRVTMEPSSWAEAIRYGVERGIPEEELVFRPSEFKGSPITPSAG